MAACLTEEEIQNLRYGHGKDSDWKHINGCAECLETLGALGKLLESTGLPEAQRALHQMGTPLRQGQSIGRYVVEHYLGAGSMGVVYRARDPELDRPVAIKLLRRDVRGTDWMRHRLLGEGRAMAKVHHPNVVPIYEINVAGEQTYVVMEFVPGQELRDWMVPRPPMRKLLNLFAKISAGLLAVHEAGLVHRDLKPENIVIDDRGQPRVLDFGIGSSCCVSPRCERRERGSSRHSGYRNGWNTSIYEP